MLGGKGQLFSVVRAALSDSASSTRPRSPDVELKSPRGTKRRKTCQEMDIDQEATPRLDKGKGRERRKLRWLLKQ